MRVDDPLDLAVIEHGPVLQNAGLANNGHVGNAPGFDVFLDFAFVAILIEMVYGKAHRPRTIGVLPHVRIVCQALELRLCPCAAVSVEQPHTEPHDRA